MALHERRRLDEASAGYARALIAEPPREPTAAQMRLARRFAPRVFTTATEPFPLTDTAVIVHPTEPWIAYHFFWADDIDFPDDNDPCDHELIWVRYDKASERITGYYTYFHQRILAAPAAAVEDASRHRDHPAIQVQWGKHGSMPLGWEKLEITADSGDAERSFYPTGRPIPLEDYHRGTFEKLSTVGRRAADSPLGQGWPLKFPGSWQDFITFSRRVEFDATRRVKVSCFNNAVLNRHFLRYNFRPKTEWPAALCSQR
ncbi:MAG: hypothetical protein ACREUU_05725 [Gammaproteobacteria bacterium]